MSAKRSDGIVRGAYWLVMSRAIGDAGLLVYYLLLARSFGPTGIGDYAFAFAVASFLVLGVSFGLRNLVVRRVARDPDDATRIAGTVLITQVGVAVLLGSIMVLVTSLLGYSPVLTGYLVLAFVALALFNLGVTFTAFLEAVGAMYLSALAGLVQKGTVVAVGIALILADASLAAVMGAHVLAGGIYLAVAWRWARRRFGSFRMTYRPGLARELFVAAMPFLATAALWQVYSKVDVVMLRLMHGEMATGLYASAYKLVSAPVFVAALVGVAAFPTLSRAAMSDPPEMKRVFRYTLRALAVIGLAGGVLLATAGDGLQVALFGAEFVESGILVRWMAPLFVLEFLTVPLWRVLLAMDRERTLLVLRLFSVGLNVALNLVLIPAYGAMGAVASSLISEGLLALAQFVLCARLVPGLFRGGRGWALAAIGVAAMGAGLFARTLMPWPLVALLAGVILAFLAAILGLVPPSEIRELLRQARFSTNQS